MTLVLNNREVQLDNKPSTQIIDKGEEAAKEEDKWKIPAASKDANDEDKTVHSSVSWKMIRKQLTLSSTSEKKYLLILR